MSREKEYWEYRALNNPISITCGPEYWQKNTPDSQIRVSPMPFGVKGLRLLDLGCGWGRNLVPAARDGASAYGVDISGKMLRHAKRYANAQKRDVNFIQADIAHLPFRNETFDVVLSIAVLQHLTKETAKKVITEIARVSKKDGKTFIQFPNALSIMGILARVRNSLFRKKNRSPTRLNYWSLEELENTFNIFFKRNEFLATSFTFPLMMQTETIDLAFVPFFMLPILVNISDRISRALESIANERVCALKRFSNNIVVVACKSKRARPG